MECPDIPRVRSRIAPLIARRLERMELIPLRVKLAAMPVLATLALCADGGAWPG